MRGKDFHKKSQYYDYYYHHHHDSLFRHLFLLSEMLVDTFLSFTFEWFRVLSLVFCEFALLSVVAFHLFLHCTSSYIHPIKRLEPVKTITALSLLWKSTRELVHQQMSSLRAEYRSLLSSCSITCIFIMSGSLLISDILTVTNFFIWAKFFNHY